jgi:hypothetical protein
MAMSLGGTTISSTIENGGGKYAFKRERLRTNGDGEAVMANYYTLTWTFEQMSLTDFTWIRSTLMSGAGSVKYSSASLYNDLGVLTSYTNAVAYEPVWDTASGGQVFGVTWIIDRIR